MMFVGKSGQGYRIGFKASQTKKYRGKKAILLGRAGQGTMPILKSPLKAYYTSFLTNLVGRAFGYPCPGLKAHKQAITAVYGQGKEKKSLLTFILFCIVSCNITKTGKQDKSSRKTPLALPILYGNRHE